MKNNFRNKYANTNLECQIRGCNEQEMEDHIFSCQILLKEYDKPLTCKYEDIFTEDLDKLLKVGKTIRELVKLRELLVEPVHD